MAESTSDENKHSNEDKSVNIPGHGSFNSYIAEGYKVIMEGVKSSSSLPSGSNYQFYQTYTNFRDKMREKSSEIHDVMEDLLRSQGIRQGVRDVLMEDALDTMLTMNDKMLDRATKYMDLMEGIKTGLSQLVQEVSGSWNKPKKADALKTFSLSIKKNIPRPQFSFKDKVDNSNVVWEPIIKDKPNSIKPLAILVEKTDDGEECFSHPYEYELEMFTVPDSQLVRIAKPKKPAPLEKAAFEYIETEEQLVQMINYLSKQTAIAVDLEHHNYRSFMGFTCLIQISSKEKDFVVDALSLRHALQGLNEVFTKSSILKVFHGADQDIIWLQRDFGVYVVNMFDTHQAAKLLNYPKLSLSYLLNLYCNIDPNKHFQLFDWRTRPLPDEAVKYAREDTHYLVYIAEMMSQQLIDNANGNKNILKAAYEQSKQICMKRFEKLIIDEESYKTVYRKGKRFFDNRQLFALKALYLWRDKTARELDESLAYVFPDTMMLNVAENLPREVQGILACCNPVPPLVKVNLLELHYLIVRAKEQPLVKVIPETTGAQVTQKTAGVSAEQQLMEQWYYPPGDIRDDLPTVLNTQDDSDTIEDTENESESIASPKLTFFSEKGTMFSTSDDHEVELDSEILNKLKGLNFVSPYQRYVQVLPYAAQIEKERKENEAKEALEHCQRSREQQALAMEIKSLQESGLIKLKKETEDIESLKFQVINERKRKANSDQGDIPNKINRSKTRADRRNQNASNYSCLDANQVDIDANIEQPELRGEQQTDVKAELSSDVNLDLTQNDGNRERTSVKRELEDDSEGMSGTHSAPPPNKLIKAPSNWKELRQQKLGKLKPFDYSQVDYSKKFGSGAACVQSKVRAASSNFDKKKKWKNNPGAKKFANKKRKRNSVV